MSFERLIRPGDMVDGGSGNVKLARQEIAF